MIKAIRSKIPRIGHLYLPTLDLHSETNMEGFLCDDLGWSSCLFSDTGFFDLSVFNFFLNPTTPKKDKLGEL
jgi:hypothetical protein